MRRPRSVARTVGVVVPVHDEAELLPRCLAALRDAGDLAGVPVHVAVVLDSCTDRSAAVVAAAGMLGASLHVLEIQRTNVGAARAAGCALLLEQLGSADVWLATTDADSAVGPGWLRAQLRYAGAGYDAVVGTVTIDDWSAYADEAQQAYARDYRWQWGHRHVHGANLGVRAEAFLQVGGFASVGADEDVGLVAALVAARRPIAWADDVPVRTSGRRRGRAPGGMSRFLAALPAAQL